MKMYTAISIRKKKCLYKINRSRFTNDIKKLKLTGEEKKLILIPNTSQTNKKIKSKAPT
jgi:hypothetical protein